MRLQIKFFWDAILNPLNEFITNSHKYRSVLYSIRGEESAGWVQHVDDVTKGLLKYIPSVLGMYTDQEELIAEYNDKFLPKQYSLQQNDCFLKIQSEVLPLVENISSIIDTLNISQAVSSVTDYSNLRSVLCTFLEQFELWYIEEMQPRCVLQYDNFLHRLSDHVKSVEVLPVTSRVKSSYDEGNELEKLLSDSARIVQLEKDYLTGSIDKTALSLELSRENLTILKTNMEDVFTNINNDVFDVSITIHHILVHLYCIILSYLILSMEVHNLPQGLSLEIVC